MEESTQKNENNKTLNVKINVMPLFEDDEGVYGIAEVEWKNPVDDKK